MFSQLPLFLYALVLAATVALADDPTLPSCGLKCASETSAQTPCKYVTNVTCTCSNSIYAKMFQECIINGCNNTADVSSIVDFGLATCKLLNITPDTGGLKGSNSNHNIVNSASSSLHAALCICMGLVTLGLANLV